MAEWTPKMDKILRDGLGRGLSSANIVANVLRQTGLQISRSAVLGRSRRLGLSKPDHYKRMLYEQRSQAKLAAIMPKTYYSDNPNQCRYFFGEGRAKTQCKAEICRRSYCAEHYLICHEIEGLRS